MTATHDQTAQDEPWPRPEADTGPSQELLDRALAGWERFLNTFEGASDE
ncbi:hypothetical protein ACQKM2_27545 [Streptomyces sp. NPDC004126]